jgi:hypothetical protein
MEHKVRIWEDFKEDFILELLEIAFGNRGYNVTNYHRIDRSHEEGIDLLCSKDLEQIAIQAKKKPKKSDAEQFARFVQNARGKRAIYVFIQDPTKEFTESIDPTRGVEFWDAGKLHAFLVENEVIEYFCLYFSKHPLILSLTRAHELILTKRKTNYTKHGFSDVEISRLWAAKDNSVKIWVSLYFVYQKWNTILMAKTEKDTHEFEGILSQIFQDLNLAYGISGTKLVSSFQELSEKHPDIIGLLWELASHRTNWAEYTGYVDRSNSTAESLFFTLYGWICPLFNEPIKNRMSGFYSSMNYLLENFKDIAKNLEFALDSVFAEMNRVTPQ